MAPKFSVYNPDVLSRDDLVSGFVARHPLLQSILADLAKPQAPHRLLIGPRGMGKTTLLKRVYFEVHDTPELTARWVPLVFREEQYNLARLSDLWLNCLGALANTLEERGDGAAADKLTELTDRIRALSPEPNRERATREALFTWSREHDRGLLLLVDNVDFVFDRMPETALWKLREVLTEARLCLIGAAAASHRATYEYQQPFYDYFRIDPLRGLDRQEAIDMLRRLATVRHSPEVERVLRADPGRVEALRILTDGNPRAILLVHHVLSRAEAGTAVDDVTALLDFSTPIYKARFEDLAQQSQQVVDDLALAWDPQPAGEVARRLAMDVGVVSAQLSRLVHDGLVEKVPYPGPRAGYQVAERLFNMWYLMRSSRRMRRKLMWLVEFLRNFCGPTQGIAFEDPMDAASLPHRPAAERTIDRLTENLAEVASTKDITAWSSWLRLADELDAHSLVNVLFETVPARDRSFEFWSNLAHAMAWDQRTASGWAASHAVAAQPKGSSDAVGRLLPSRALRAAGIGAWPMLQRSSESALAEPGAQARWLHDLHIHLRVAFHTGEGANALAWLDSTDLGDRARPLREALHAALHGAAHLQTVAPEVRPLAERCHRWMVFEWPEVAASSSGEGSKRKMRSKAYGGSRGSQRGFQ